MRVEDRLTFSMYPMTCLGSGSFVNWEFHPVNTGVPSNKKRNIVQFWFRLSSYSTCSDWSEVFSLKSNDSILGFIRYGWGSVSSDVWNSLFRSSDVSGTGTGWSAAESASPMHTVWYHIPTLSWRIPLPPTVSWRILIPDVSIFFIIITLGNAHSKSWLLDEPSGVAELFSVI